MIYIVFAALIVAGDQILKWWVSANLTELVPEAFIPGVVNLT